MKTIKTRYSVLGADGFIGSSLVRYLRARGHDCESIGRKDSLPQRFGHAVFCVGVGSDFRTRPFDIMDAHVSLLVRILRTRNFESFTYLSSTRVYQGLPVNNVAREDLALVANPNDSGNLYNTSKIAGENLCLTIDDPAIKVLRLSNVYGPEDQTDHFLTSILRQVLTRGSATFFNAMTSHKDYIAVSDVMRALECFPVRASSRLMNLASGQNVSNHEIADLILRYTGCAVTVVKDAPEIQFPQIDITRLINELGLRPSFIAEEFPRLVAGMRQSLLAAP